MTDAVFVTSPDGVVKVANSAACKLLGYSEEELLGRSIIAILDEREREGFDLLQAAQETRETVVRTRGRADHPRLAHRLADRERRSAVPGQHLRRAQHHRPQARGAAHPLSRPLRRAHQSSQPHAVPSPAAADHRPRAAQRPGGGAAVPRHGPLQGGQRHLRARRRRPRARGAGGAADAARCRRARCSGASRATSSRCASTACPPEADNRGPIAHLARAVLTEVSRAFQLQPARGVPHRQHRHRVLPARCGERHRPHPQRRCGDVLLQAERRQHLRVLLPGDERRGGRAADPEEQAAPRARARRARDPLPAQGRSRRPAASSAPRRCCAGACRGTATFRRRSSSRSRRRPTSSSTSASGC